MFTRPQQDVRDSLFVLRPWCNAIRVRTPPALQCTCASLCFHINCMKPLWKVVLASVICTPAESKFPFSARSSPRVTSVSSFLLKMSSSLGRQYDTADSRAAKLNSLCWRILVRTAKCVRTSLRMERVPINLWPRVCISRLQTVGSSSL